MPAGDRTLLASGKRRISATGRRVLSNASGPCCCGPCTFGPNFWDCPDIEECLTTNAGELQSVCCYSKNDTLVVTMGTITAGTGPYDPDEEEWVDAVAALVSDLSGETRNLYNCWFPDINGYRAIFRYDSPSIYSDDDYFYGYWLSVEPGTRGGPGWGPSPSPEIFFNVIVEMWRVRKEDYNKAGVCSVDATILLITTNGIDFNAPQGTCCESIDPIPMRSARPNLVASVGDSTDVVITSECDPICSCLDFADSYLVEASCGTGVVARTPEENVCEWSFSGSTGSLETCDLVETSITLRHSYADDGFCGWVLEVSRTTYGLVGEDCDIVEQIIVKARLAGSDPVGEYEIYDGTGCGTTIEVS
jgi:hypothetical protein